jgi:hypothetical protein
MVKVTHAVIAIVADLALLTSRDQVGSFEISLDGCMAIDTGRVWRAVGELTCVAGMTVYRLGIQAYLVPVQAEGGGAVVEKYLCAQAGIKLAPAVVTVTGMAAGGEVHMPVQPFFAGDFFIHIGMAGDTFLSQRAGQRLVTQVALLLEFGVRAIALDLLVWNALLAYLTRAKRQPAAAPKPDA